MANNKAFVYEINPDGSGSGELGSVHQSAPNWVLSFVRWADRDTLRHNPNKDVDFTKTRETDPLVVENDCIQVSTSVSKGALTPNMSATLVQTDVNYMTSIAPGDFVIVNMLNWKEDSRRVASKARLRQSINGIDDGFKGIFKIQSVRKMLQVDPNTGIKMLVFKITGFAFTEFNNTIYFQPEMITDAEKTNAGLYASNIGSNWALLTSNKGLTNGQDIIRALIDSFIGNGISQSGQRDKLGNIKSPNTLFYIPKILGSLLGVKGATAAKDIYNYLFGIQKYAGGSSKNIAQGFNPAGRPSVDGRFYYTASKCRGESVQKPEYWNQVKLWSILQQFTNSPLNELFTTFRVSPEGFVMPTVVYRQIPFTNEDFKANSVQVTKFMTLPRWKPHPALILGMDVGREEAARINFVQYFGRSALNSSGWGVSEETAQKNYLFDVDDVKRSGLRPYVVSTTFDITKDKQVFAGPIWAKIVGDALIGGHLKLNGTFDMVGIVAPIAVGDNLEFDGVVYHIEEVSHACTISADGRRLFRTKVRVSSGLSVDSSEAGTRYAEMENSDAQSNLQADWENDQLMPGISESQDIHSRPNSLDTPVAIGKPFPQPNVGTSTRSSERIKRKKK